MRAASLIDFLRGRGIDVWLERGKLRARRRDGAPLASEDAEFVRNHARAIAGHLRGLTERSPAPPPAVRPNLHDLAARYRRLFGASCKAAYREVTGVDLDEQNPDWPDLEHFDRWLRERSEDVGGAAS